METFRDAANEVPSRWREPRASGLDARALRAALASGDDAADALTDALASEPSGRRARILEDRIAGAPPGADANVDRFFESLVGARVGLRDEELHLGAATMLRGGLASLWALTGISLGAGYRDAGIVKPLAATGALLHDARARLLGTGRFVFAIATSPSLAPGTEGFRATLRIRLLHARIRRGLRRSPAWRTAEWGLPINQRDMLATALQFSVALVVGLRALGLRITPREADAVVHLWLGVGTLLGTHRGLLPTSFESGFRLWSYLDTTHRGPDEDSRALARSLLEAPLRPPSAPLAARWLGEGEARFLAGYMRAVIGDAAADGLALPHAEWRRSVPLVAATIGALERARRALPFGDVVARRAGRAIVLSQIRRLERRVVEERCAAKDVTAR